MLQGDHSFVNVNTPTAYQDISFEVPHFNPKQTQKTDKTKKDKRKDGKPKQKSKFVNFLQNTTNDCVNLGRKIYTNTKYSLNKTRKYDRGQMLKEEGYVNLLGAKMLSFEISQGEGERNLKEFENHIKWCSYRENLKGLRNGNGKRFTTDASKISRFWNFN